MKKYYWILIVLFLFSSLFSGLVFAVEPKLISFTVKKFIVEGDIPIPVAEVDAILTPYDGKEFNLNGLQKVAKQLEAVIRDRGFSFYRVVITPQSLTANQIILKVVNFQIADIAFKGNQYFTNENLLNSLPGLEVGQSPNTENLARQLKMANRHPSKDTKLTFKQSKTAGFVDAMLNVQDSKPQMFSMILANTGSKETGDLRLTTAYQHANLFNRDHLLNLSYTTSPTQPQDVKQGGFSYNAPFYKPKGWLSAYFIYSNVNSGTIFDTFNVAGSGEMAGIHWLQYLPRKGHYEHWLDVGIDSRFFDNDVTQIGSNVAIVDDIRSMPFSLQYQGEYAWRKTRVGFRMQWLTNTGWGSYNNKDDYASSGGRAGASDEWDSLKFGADISHQLGKWTVNAVLDSQYANEPLISGEQFGIGGSTSVRGYEENETSADSGYTLRTELHAPKWKEIIFLGFIDYGYGQIENSLPGSVESWHLASFGVGARGQFMKHFLFSVDLAHALESTPVEFGPTEIGDFRVHATLIMQF